MAESKSEQFSFAIKSNSEKIAKFGPNSINSLGRVSESRLERVPAAWRPYDLRRFSFGGNAMSDRDKELICAGAARGAGRASARSA